MQRAEHYVAVLLSALARTPDRVVLWWRDRPITGAELSRSITTAALVLRREGIGEASTVALLITGNSPEMLVARYAANLLGATVLCPQSLNAIDALDEISVGTQAGMLAESNAALLVVDSQNVERAREISARMGTHPTLATLAANGGESSSDLVNLSSAPGAGPFDLATAVSAGIAMVNYTSGSTGRPKGVARTFAALSSVIAYFRNGVVGRPTLLITIPLHGSTAASNSDTVLATEGTIVLHGGFDPAAVLAAIARYGVTSLVVSPPQLYQLVDHPARATTDTSTLRQIRYTGCTASPRRIAQAAEAFGPVLTQLYGMTEAMAISTLGPPAHRNPKLLTTVGLPLPVVQLGIRDPRTGEDLPAGQSGEICVRSPFLMDGYWRDPEATAQVMRGGWLHTGDIGYLDDEGYLHLVDRLARMIKTRGVKVYPATIEDVLLAQPTVAQAAVYRAVDTDQVEHVYAAVEPRRGATIDPAELRVQVERKLSATHAPVRIIVLDALPLLDSGKPDERRLRFEAEIAAGWRLPTEAACVDPL